MMSFECVTLAVLLSRVTAHCKWHKSSYSCFTTKFRLHIQKLTTSSRIIPHTSTEQVSPTHPDRGTKRPQHKGIPVWEASLILGASSPQQRWKKNKIRARDFGRAIPSAPLGASSTRPAWEHISPRFCIVSAPAVCTHATCFKCHTDTKLCSFACIKKDPSQTARGVLPPPRTPLQNLTREVYPQLCFSR